MNTNTNTNINTTKKDIQIYTRQTQIVSYRCPSKRGRDIIYYDSEGKQISFTEAIYNMVYWVAHCTPSSTRHLAEHPYTSTNTNTNIKTNTNTIT